MATAVGRRFADPGAHHHIAGTVEQQGNEAWSTRRVVGGISIDQHIEIGLNVAEHPPHHIPLTLARFVADYGTGGAGLVGSAVG